MKTFKIQTAGYEVTNENYKEIAEKIKSKYGICPALNNIIMAVVGASEEEICNKKTLNRLIKNVTHELGITTKQMNDMFKNVGPEF